MSTVCIHAIVKGKAAPLGIVTERDFVNRICAAGTSSGEISVHEIMPSPIVTVEKEATIETAADLMLSNKIWHLVVVDEQTKRPVGILAPSDLNKHLRSKVDKDEVNARILKPKRCQSYKSVMDHLPDLISPSISALVYGNT